MKYTKEERKKYDKIRFNKIKKDPILYGEFKRKAKIHNKKYNQKPEIKERNRNRNKTLKWKEWKKKWIRKNKDKILKYEREYRKKNKKAHYKYLTRAETYRKYGKLPEDYQYHHTTIPYTVDEWIGLTIEDHNKLRRHN